MRRPNLVDPDYEPTDEELAELMRRAFADATPRRVRAEQLLRERSLRARDEAREAFERLDRTPASSE